MRAARGGTAATLGTLAGTRGAPVTPGAPSVLPTSCVVPPASWYSICPRSDPPLPPHLDDLFPHQRPGPCTSPLHLSFLARPQWSPSFLLQPGNRLF